MKKTTLFLFILLFIVACSSQKGSENNESKIIPSEALWDGESFGVVTLSVCNMRKSADFSSEMISQALLGMPVRVIRQDNWYQIQTPDDYKGCVYPSAITPMTRGEYNSWNAAEKVVVTAHYGFAYSEANILSHPVSDVVAGNRLKWEGEERDFFKVSYPDGRKAFISKAIAEVESAWRTTLKQDTESILSSALSLTGIPYLWAGTSSKGVDCSGFVRTILYMHDIIIPRDAYQQAAVGKRIEIAADFSNLLPGDLIFFGRKATAETNERVIHVAFYLGDKRFIHSQGDVRISSFDPTDDCYDAFNLNRLLFATRMLDQVNQTPEINTTLTNPYYTQQ